MDPQLILDMLGGTLSDLAEKGVGPGLGTLFGALSAFKLERLRENRALARDRDAALKRAKFVLSAIRESLATLQTRYLEPMRADPARWRNLAALASPQNTLTLDLNSLAFLVDLGEEGLLRDVLRCQTGYAAVLTAVQERKQTQERFWSALDRIRGEVKEGTTHRELDELVGPVFTGPLMSITDALYQSVGEILPFVEKTEAVLIEFLERARKTKLLSRPTRRLETDG